MIRDCDPRGAGAALSAMAARPDSTPLLAEIDKPCLVIVGEEDVISSAAEMKEFSDSIPDCEYQVIPGAGHMAPMENPDAVNQAFIKYLERVHSS